jgi:hypothetical protein
MLLCVTSFLVHKMEEKITETKGEHWDHIILPIQHSLTSPTMLHMLDLSCQNVTPTTVKCRSTIHDYLGGGGGEGAEVVMQHSP